MTMHLREIYDKYKKRDEGLTMVEVVTSVIIFSIIVLSIVSMVQYVQYAELKAYYVSEAKRAAQSQIANLRSKGIDEVGTGVKSFSSNSSLDHLPDGKEGRTTITHPTLAPDSLKVDITVSYPIGDQTQKVFMSAYITPDKDD